MVLDAFHHRSGRVIATSRLVLAASFLVASWLDPGGLGGFAALEAGILAGYVAAAAVYLAATWSNWRLESRLAGPAHLADIGLFTILVFLTEGYTSPFFPFYMFLLLSATMRWNWRVTAATALVVTFLYILAGAAAITWAGGEFDLLRLVFRGATLGVMSLVLIWFGLNQQAAAMRLAANPDALHDHGIDELPVRGAMAFAAGATGARRTLFVWCEEEEPWIYTAILDGDLFQHERHRPDAFAGFVAPELEGCAFLFGGGGDDVLISAGRRARLLNVTKPVDPGLRKRFGLDAGLAVPIQADGYRGVLFTLNVPGSCADDLEVGEQLGMTISAAMQRASSAANAKEAAVARTRLGFTRDFHDRFLQLLAGAAMRIEGIRKSAAAGRDVNRELDALRDQLSSEQRELRRLIGELRGSVRAAAGTELCDGLRVVADRLSEQWGISCTVARCEESVNNMAHLEHDLHHIVREAVANAVRHGRARRVAIAIDRAEGGGVLLEIADDGEALPAGTAETPTGRLPMPWSLHERVNGLGGHLSLVPRGRGSRLTVSLPEEAPR